MKKCNLFASLCLCGGIVAAFWLVSFLFRIMHFPGASWLLMIACLSTILVALVTVIGLPKADPFEALIARCGTLARNLRNTFLCINILLMIFSIGLIFRIMHWPFGYSIVFFSGLALMFSIILLGVFAYQVINKNAASC